MGLSPSFKILANKKNITDAIKQRLISLRVTDEAGNKSDEIELTIEDTPPHVELPATGATLEIYIGYDGINTRMGLFYVDEVEPSGPPDQIRIRAKAAPFATKTGVRLQSQKTRTWPTGTTLGDLVKKVSTDHGLAPVISADMARIALPHTSQTDESDIHLITRLARRYNGTAKLAENKLIVVKRSAGVTASGKTIPVATLRRSEVTNYRATFAKREQAGSVTAKYHDPVSGTTKAVTIGSGEPKQSIRHKYPDESSARAAANARLEKKQRAASTLSITMPGRESLQAEGKITLLDFRPGLNQTWTLKRVEHVISNSGFITSIEAEIGAVKQS